MKIVNNTQVAGFFTGHDVRLDITSHLQKPIILSDYGISIVDKAADGKVIFNK